MEVLQYMTPEGLERILLLDGALVRLEDVRDTLSSALRSPSSTTKDSKQPQHQLQSSTLRLVPACCALHGKRKSQQ